MLAFLVVGALAAAWHWGWDITVLDYGDPAKTYFDVTSAAPGDTIHIHFDDVRWLRVCRSRFVQQVTCQQIDPIDPSRTITSRLDLEAHPIDVPPRSGVVVPKSRRFVVPPECRPGPLTFTGYAESTCPPFFDWNPRYSVAPELHLQIK
jgi:hypothetical protein